LHSPALKLEIELKTGFFSTLPYSLEISKRTLILKSDSQNFEDFYIPFSDIENISIFFNKRNEIEISLKEKTLVALFRKEDALDRLRLVLHDSMGENFSVFF